METPRPAETNQPCLFSLPPSFLLHPTTNVCISAIVSGVSDPGHSGALSLHVSSSPTPWPDAFRRDAQRRTLRVVAGVDAIPTQDGQTHTASICRQGAGLAAALVTGTDRWAGQTLDEQDRISSPARHIHTRVHTHTHTHIIYMHTRAHTYIHIHIRAHMSLGRVYRKSEEG